MIAAITGSARRRCATAARWSVTLRSGLDADDRAVLELRQPRPHPRRRPPRSGGRPRLSVSVIFRSSGSIRCNSLSLAFATQTAPSPTVIPPGTAPSSAGSPESLFVAGSIEHHVLVAGVCDPHATLAEGDVRRCVADTDRFHHAVAVRVDSRDRRAAGVRRPRPHPHRRRRSRDAEPTLIGRPTTLFVCGSIRRTVPSNASATQTPPAARRRHPSTRDLRRSSSVRRPVCASTREIREPRPSVTHSEPSPKAT